MTPFVRAHSRLGFFLAFSATSDPPIANFGPNFYSPILISSPRTRWAKSATFPTIRTAFRSSDPWDDNDLSIFPIIFVPRMRTISMVTPIVMAAIAANCSQPPGFLSLSDSSRQAKPISDNFTPIFYLLLSAKTVPIDADALCNSPAGRSPPRSGGSSNRTFLWNDLTLACCPYARRGRWNEP